VAVPTALLLLWQVAAQTNWIDKRLYPAPTSVFSNGWHLFIHGRLRADIVITLKRILLGFAFGASVGMVLGTIMGASRLVRAAFEPLLNALYVVPKLALLPVFLTIFGLGDAPKIVLVAVTTFFFVWIGAMEAIATVPEGYREAARSLGVSRARMFYDVMLPAALPQLFVALRVAIGVAVLVIVAAEFIVGSTGLGYLIFSSRAIFANDAMYAGIVCVAVAGVILAGIVSWIGKQLTPWTRPTRSR
jgi:sulfonate transport system permease protein